ncbi:hypothetical protein FJZ53_03285 [Candidatus Woesearchaeota archaeon]|nr:hypothetical protein [Candidatus Woesearchaeota archaeon]
MKNLCKKLLPFICALGITTAYPAAGIENNTKGCYKDVKKVKITRSTLQWFNDYDVKTESKFIIVERTYKDGRVLTEYDMGIDGVLDGTADYEVMRYEKVYRDNGCETTVIEEDRGNDGTIDYRKTHKQMLGGSVTEEDFGADGKIDVKITEMLCSGGVIIRDYYGADGKIGTREKKIFAGPGITVTQNDLLADGFIDSIETETVLDNGDRILETKVYGTDGSESVYLLTEKNMPDGSRVTEFDMNNDDIPDYRERETLTKFLGGAYTKVREVEKNADGKVNYRSIEEVLELDIP